MFRRLFHFSPDAEEAQDASLRDTRADDAEGGPDAMAAATDSFDHVYQSAAVKPPRLAYGILKVADMLNSQHLAGMSNETKRSSILMALEAAGAEVDYLLEDAVFRQRALHEHEEGLLKTLKEFEAVKAAEIARIQAELDRLTAQCMANIQAHLDEVAREQDSLRAWQKRKQQEAQRITEAVKFCVPPGAVVHNDGLSMVLERAAAARR
jgi:hypothetical protein